MNKKTFYLSVEEALELHRMLINQFGGSHGARDLGLIESSVYRPQSGYYQSLSIQAAAILQSFALNHCFVDGNKRMSIACTAVFLKLNGFSLKIRPKDGEIFIVNQVIKEKISVEAISKWLESRMHPAKK